MRTVRHVSLPYLAYSVYFLSLFIRDVNIDNAIACSKALSALSVFMLIMLILKKKKYR